MKAAVGGSLKHFLLDATKRKLMRDWLRGVSEREIQKIYTDPLFGSPKREQIEDVVREQVRLQLAQKDETARKLEFQLAVERHVFKKVA